MPLLSLTPLAFTVPDLRDKLEQVEKIQQSENVFHSSQLPFFEDSPTDIYDNANNNNNLNISNKLEEVVNNQTFNNDIMVYSSQNSNFVFDSDNDPEISTTNMSSHGNNIPNPNPQVVIPEISPEDHNQLINNADPFANPNWLDHIDTINIQARPEFQNFFGMFHRSNRFNYSHQPLNDPHYLEGAINNYTNDPSVFEVFRDYNLDGEFMMNVKLEYMSTLFP